MRLSPERRLRESNNPYYDLFEDWDLIISSFLSQYGIRIRTKEFESVSWDEFRSLLSGLSPDTALGRIVAIRSETDSKVIEHFTSDQKRIYNEWQNRRVKAMPQDVFEKEMENLEKMFAGLLG